MLFSGPIRPMLYAFRHFHAKQRIEGLDVLHPIQYFLATLETTEYRHTHPGSILQYLSPGYTNPGSLLQYLFNIWAQDILIMVQYFNIWALNIPILQVLYFNIWTLDILIMVQYFNIWTLDKLILFSTSILGPGLTNPGSILQYLGPGLL